MDFVADAEAMVDETLLVIAAVDNRFRTSIAVVDECLVRALDAELNYRKVKGSSSAMAVSRSILKRCSRLIARHIRLMSRCTSGSRALRR